MRTLLVAALLIAVPMIALAPTAEAQREIYCLHSVMPCCTVPLCLDDRLRDLEPCRDPITGYYYC